MIPEHIQNRKGPRSTKDLNPEVVEYLNKGLVETKNLIEWLATDQLKLLKLVLASLQKDDWYVDFETAVLAQKKPTANSNTKVIGQTFGVLTKDSKVYEQLRSHTSDLVRCWACWGKSLHFDVTQELIEAMIPYAADTHFGVREVVIFAIKERLINDLEVSIKILSSYVQNEDENVRRFVAEVLRPIGVWTKKVTALQECPELGLPLITPLKNDGSKYVRDAVANWLNDASKSQPDWVLTLVTQWEKESVTKETAYIVKRALRTINKKK